VGPCARLVHDGLGIVYDLMWTSSQLSWLRCEDGHDAPHRPVGCSPPQSWSYPSLDARRFGDRAPCQGSRIRTTPSA
jgi:hypothetical protein